MTPSSLFALCLDEESVFPGECSGFGFASDLRPWNDFHVRPERPHQDGTLPTRCQALPILN